jgi:DNA-binding response OmpR family regulator
VTPGVALVVDDSPMVVRLLTIALEGAGWDVVPAATAAEAVDALGREPDLVLLDGVLPDADGGAVLAEVRRRRPAARVLVVSGLEAGAVAGADGYLRKPFTVPQVHEAIDAALGGGGG